MGVDMGTFIGMVVYCLCGTSLTIINKLVMNTFPYPNVVLIMQCAITVVLVFPASMILPPDKNTKVEALQWAKVRVWLPQVLFFFAMLLTSLVALKHVSVTTLTVIRNLISLVVCGVDMAVLGTKMSTTAIGSLCGILLGALLYGYGDLTFSVVGYIWLCANIVATAAFQINIKKLIPVVKLGTLSMTYYNNTLCLPFFALMGLVEGESAAYDKIWDLAPSSHLVLFFSCIFGFLLSVVAFYLNTKITATSLMVLNNCNKFAVILFNEMFISMTLGPISMFGTVVVMVFGGVYSFDKIRPKDTPPAPVTMVAPSDVEKGDGQ